MRVLEEKVVEKDRVIVKQKETLQGQFHKECEANVKLKEFIEDLGYDPETFQRLPMNPRCDPVAENVVRTEGAEVDIAGMGARVGEGVETPVVDRVVVVIVTEGVVGADGSNPSTEGTGSYW
ncbi:hypothetical protein GIB67_029626 [Kingdonia uniflora]|uniref:Uncharacterized protein n=1 Tax=Kingdonia uniflora TaxID=39325 RepID=A0A7J7LLD9_9MAGN|nr:hypothetical protein GIB67_029626 [Kingdonia uniflora]